MAKIYRIPSRPSVGWMLTRAMWNRKHGREYRSWVWLFRAVELAHPHPVCIIVKEENRDQIRSFG